MESLSGTNTSSCADREALIRFNHKLQLVCDRVGGVATGHHTGCLLTGRGGIGKSQTATGELNRRKTPFVLHNSHMTPRGLFDALADNPDKVHLIEDAEEVIRHPVALGVLRSATWGNGRDRDGRVERVITWNTFGARPPVKFYGGIILISNRPLVKLPELAAFATRIPCIDLEVSDEEIAALMRDVASKGYQNGAALLDPKECLEVAEFIITEAKRSGRPLHMRLLINGFADRLQADDCEAGCSWRDLVASSVHGSPTVVHETEPVSLRVQKKQRELEVARKIVGLARSERLTAWQSETGKSQATLYRRLEELARVDALDFQG